MLLAEALKIDISKARWVAETEDRIYEPNLRNHKRYIKANERLNRLYESILIDDDEEVEQDKEENDHGSF